MSELVRRIVRPLTSALVPRPAPRPFALAPRVDPVASDRLADHLEEAIEVVQRAIAHENRTHGERLRQHQEEQEAARARTEAALASCDQATTRLDRIVEEARESANAGAEAIGRLGDEAREAIERANQAGGVATEELVESSRIGTALLAAIREQHRASSAMGSEMRTILTGLRMDIAAMETSRENAHAALADVVEKLTALSLAQADAFDDLNAMRRAVREHAEEAIGAAGELLALKKRVEDTL
ncbi:hypothetical protein [Miltoncostaea oceani]|uniref:hypothetical protein n=1 Tax=Miltoncostaea oceani TaxID=2843216 RepID=UPI001C3DCB40|nr:hypothetical protein [Miltoncostaea oceani]